MPTKPKPTALAPTWTLGAVWEDRWGLRWRADIRIPGAGHGWQCRSVGLRIWRATEQMAERGPLRYIRTDRISGDAARLNREAGEAEDAAVRVDGETAEDADDG